MFFYLLLNFYSSRNHQKKTRNFQGNRTRFKTRLILEGEGWLQSLDT